MLKMLIILTVVNAISVCMLTAMNLVNTMIITAALDTCVAKKKKHDAFRHDLRGGGY